MLAALYYDEQFLYTLSLLFHYSVCQILNGASPTVQIIGQGRIHIQKMFCGLRISFSTLGRDRKPLLGAGYYCKSGYEVGVKSSDEQRNSFSL